MLVGIQSPTDEHRTHIVAFAMKYSFRTFVTQSQTNTEPFMMIIIFVALVIIIVVVVIVILIIYWPCHIAKYTQYNLPMSAESPQRIL